MLRSFIFGLVACVGVNFMATATYAQECKSRARTEPSISASVDDENPSKDLTIDFDHFAIGKVPQNFISLLLGKGKAVDWEIRSEPTARSSPNVLAEISTEEKQFRFPLLLHDKFSAKNVEVSVHFKPISGKIDQAAGVVARYQDEKRFYVIQASAIENEVKLYKVVDETQQVINGASAQVTSGKWHEILYY